MFIQPRTGFITEHALNPEEEIKKSKYRLFLNMGMKTKHHQFSIFSVIQLLHEPMFENNSS